MSALIEARRIGIPGRLAATDLEIEAGQMVAVIGPNGGGKTSLLRALARTDDALGTVTVDKLQVDDTAEPLRRRLLAFLPSSREVTWPIKLDDFLGFGLGAPDVARVEQIIAMLELDKLAGRAIDELSTGERARAMLGRAIAGRARLLLLDEPLSNLDPYWAIRTTEIIRGEVANNASAALVSVHDLEMAGRFDRVVLVAGGQLLADGTAAEVLGSKFFQAAFRVERTSHGWAISGP